jgi:hypothetical protein
MYLLSVWSVWFSSFVFVSDVDVSFVVISGVNSGFSVLVSSFARRSGSQFFHLEKQKNWMKKFSDHCLIVEYVPLLTEELEKHYCDLFYLMLTITLSEMWLFSQLCLNWGLILTLFCTSFYFEVDLSVLDVYLIEILTVFFRNF